MAELTVDIDEIEERMEQADAVDRLAEVIKHFPTFKIRYQKLTQGKSQYGMYNRYRVTINNHEQTYKYTFNDSIANTQRGTMSNDFTIFHSIIVDAGCYEYCDSLEEFANEYGYDLYENRKQAEKAFNSCREEYEALIRLFGAEGYEILHAISTNY